MDRWLRNLEAFERKWLTPLNQDSVQVTFKMARLIESAPDPQKVADEFASQHGYQRIAPHWLSLQTDSTSKSTSEASALLAEVLSKDLVFPRYRWLTPADASQCAEDFVSSFKPSPRYILTNRNEFAGNWIGDWTFEWAFVGFDKAKIALLLLQAED